MLEHTRGMFTVTYWKKPCI